MEAHPAIGERILRNVEGYEEIADVVRHHHERVDGHGYPDGLSVSEIPSSHAYSPLRTPTTQ